MSLHDEVVSGVIGAVAGGLTGAFTGWWLAPTQAEREEWGRKRLEGKSQIAKAAALLNYQMTEARGRLFRLEEIGDLMDRARFLEFAGAVNQGSMFLRAYKRIWVKRKAKKLVGRLVWRLAEMVPPQHYCNVDEASILKATADTRTSTDQPVYGPALVMFPPTSPRWDEALRILDGIRKAYPS